ncbi:MAG: class I SAM-dependent methyltransferase [Acidobacteriota bacterium]
MIDAKEREWDALGSNHVGILFDSLNWKIDRIGFQQEDLRALLKAHTKIKNELDEIVMDLKMYRKIDVKKTKDLSSALESLSYHRFETHFRGWQEEVKKRQEIYLKYFKGKKNVLDLGCGRGEFLEILKENGIESYGIDLNDEMVQVCKEKGIKCVKADILEHLLSIDDESLGGIFSSQVIEHLEPNYLQKLIGTAFVKLKSDSYLILETINPKSLFALSEIFSRDFTHRKPVHPETLKFLLESAGFGDIEIIYLSEVGEKQRLKEIPEDDERFRIISDNFRKINNILFGFVDYAIVGLKK